MTAGNAVGLDTGVFDRVLGGHEQAVEIFEHLMQQETPGFVSCISLYELTKLRHRGVLDPEKAEVLLARIPSAFKVVWLDKVSLLRRAAGLSHGNNIPMADALILASCLQEGCDVLYTTDTDLTHYDGADLEVVVLQ